MRERRRKERLLKIFSIFIFSVLITYFLPFSEEKIYTLRIGEVPQRDIIAPFTFKIPKSKEEIKKEREEILKKLTLVLSPILRPSLDQNLIESQLENLDIKTRKKFIEEINKTYEEIKDYVILGDIDTIRKLNSEFVILLTPEGDKFFPVNKIYSLIEVKEIIKKRALKVFPFNEQLSFLFEELISPFIVPNYKIDFEETEIRKQKLLERIEEFKGVVYKGEVIAKKGEPLSKIEIEKLEAMEIAKRKSFISKILILSLRYIFFLIILLFSYYSIRFLFPEIYGDTKMLLLIIFNSLFFMILSSLIIKITKTSLYIPFAFIPFFFYFVTGRKFALFLTVVLSILCAVYSGFSLFFLIYFLAIGISGILISKFLRNRLDLIFGFFILLFLSIILSFFFKIYASFQITNGEIFISSLFSSSLSILGTITLLPLHEKFLGITTDFFLLELSNPEHPLLKELEIKAPGTFEHSIQMSELARIAAEKIGANSLLAKVGALYHDIGKIETPKFFVENLKDPQENPHNKISPTVSVTILQNHVKKGVELAKKYRLPESIIRIIERHHGTLLMFSFYEKAKKINSDVREEDYRYKCPKPEKKEEAIIMLLDGIEAKVRSLEKHEFQSIRDAIDDVINHRFSDGQFDECEITRKDMEKIKDAILPKLIHRFHVRVTYPPLKAKEKIV
ncbi:MAG: HDIG domain-containing metalloprotein [candidate division WOR-3 bacterium]